MADFLDEYFRTTRTVPVTPEDLGPIGEDVLQHFRLQNYVVSGSRLASGGWYISIHRGDWFRAILGLKTALNITIDRTPGGTLVSAGVGIFELQALPTIITIFVFAPVVLGQIWGIIRQNELDEEAVRFVEDRLAYYAGANQGSEESAAARAMAEAELGGGV
ncbi:MAG: hypothetical protein SFU56_20715 [Capsulimonadales bacterium]|nr:hypothetical protein [Capsulimonadales bacterium]